MEQSLIWLYLGVYFSGVVVAVIFHRCYFSYQDEPKLSNREFSELYNQFSENEGDDLPISEYIARSKASMLGYIKEDHDDDIFAPIRSDDFKFFVWLSWISVAIWLSLFLLKVLGVSMGIGGKALTSITDKMVK